MSFKKPFNLSLFTIAIVLLFIASNTNWGEKSWRNTLESDAKGYYAYNPAVFIYHDLNFLFFKEIEQEKYYQEHLFVDYRAFLEEGIVNKYYAGTALAQSPFFLIAHALSKIYGNDADGYSKLYMQLINIAAIFYCILGLFFLGKTLDFYQINRWNKIITITVITFGTNLFIYTIAEPGMSHVYSFGFVSAFIFFSHKFFYSNSSKSVLAMGICFGIICLIRPINGLIIFGLPSMAKDLNQIKSLISNLFNAKKYFLLAILFFISIVSIQAIIYKISTGHFWIYSYTNEGFNFLNPHFMDTLFSYKKGLFLYTPVYLASLLGLFYLGKKSKFKTISFISFFIFITYIFSSWWMWFYGGSFSSRVFVEYLPFFCYSISRCNKLYKKESIKGLILCSSILANHFVPNSIFSVQILYHSLFRNDSRKILGCIFTTTII
jgi:hypothetical protein